jgi:hypothetical protein
MRCKDKKGWETLEVLDKDCVKVKMALFRPGEGVIGYWWPVVGCY